MNKNKLLGYAYPPEPNELRSSWLRRLAYANDGNFQSFCHRLCERRRLWLLDIDCLEDPILEEALFASTISSKEQIRQTSLLSFQGIIVEKIRPGGNGRFILPSNPRMRNFDSTGVQWCPLCLDEGIAYWRKNWRLSFVTTCIKHQCVLADRCSDCGACPKPISRGDLKCWHCGYDARRHPIQPADTSVLQLQDQLLSYLNFKKTTPMKKYLKFEESHPVLTFQLLWILMRLVTTGYKSKFLRIALKEDAAENNIRWRFEVEGVNSRHQIMKNIFLLTTAWPESFVSAAKSAHLVWSDLLRGTNEEDIPFQYRELLLRYFHPQPQLRNPTGKAKYARR